MRILQVITLCDLGGAQSVVVNLANRLVKEHEVIVAAGAGDGKMWLLLHPSVICERIPSLRRALSLLNEIKTIRAMRKLYNLKSATPFPKCYLHKEKWTFDS